MRLPKRSVYTTTAPHAVSIARGAWNIEQHGVAYTLAEALQRHTRGAVGGGGCEDVAASVVPNRDRRRSGVRCRSSLK